MTVNDEAMKGNHYTDASARNVKRIAVAWSSVPVIARAVRCRWRCAKRNRDYVAAYSSRRSCLRHANHASQDTDHYI